MNGVYDHPIGGIVDRDGVKFCLTLGTTEQTIIGSHPKVAFVVGSHSIDDALEENDCDLLG